MLSLEEAALQPEGATGSMSISWSIMIDVYKRQGLELHDVLEQAGDEGVDLEAMEEAGYGMLLLCAGKDVYKRQTMT